MITIKTIVFALALISTLVLIEDIISKIILNSKKDRDEYHLQYTQGYSEIIDRGKGYFMILLWTGFYLLNLL